MDLTGAITAGRALAQSLMVDACTIRARTGAGTQDETTGRVTRTSSVLYSGACRLQSEQRQPRTVEAAGRTASVELFTLSIPAAAAAIPVGAVATIDTAVFQASLVGRTFRVVSVAHKTHATAQRLSVEETTA